MRFNTRRISWAPLKRAGFLIIFATLSGCEIPTELPIFDVRWVFPIEETSISVDELLPTGVAISGTNFAVTVAPIGLTQNLGTLCGDACTGVDGLTVPKPPFSASFQNGGALPADVVSAILVSGSISFAIQNNLGFDPIRPAVADPGTMTITIHDVDALGPVLGQVILDGATDAIPDGALTIVPLTLTPGTVSAAFVAVIEVDSPLGDTNILIDVTADLVITATPGGILASSATLNVDGMPVSLDPTSPDVSDVDSDIVDRIQSGGLVLDIVNPFGVGLDMMVEISGPISIIRKPLVISSAPTSSVVITYTPDEFSEFLGQPDVVLSADGTVVAPAGPATVSPTLEVLINTSLDLTLEVGP